MKKIILATTLILFIYCEKRSDNRVENKSKLKDKESFNHSNFEDDVVNGVVINSNVDNPPIELALTFINSYIEESNKLNKSVGYLNFVKSSKLTTNRFKTELQKIVDEAEKEDPEMGLGFNPIVPGNDHPEKGFEFESYNSKTNYIVVKGIDWADFKVTIKVAKEENKWLVDGCGVVNIPEEKQ